MDEYLLILKEKAKKIDADIESCANDKDCIKEVIAAKVKSNLENEKVSILIEKAQKIDADIKSCGKDKDCILVAIEQRIKTILEEENELHSSIQSQENFKPLYFEQPFGDITDIG